MRMGSANLLAGSASLQIDLNLDFLTKLPGIEKLTFSNSCNGLLLFENRKKSWPFYVLGYFVCNPATEQWMAVPSYGSPPSSVFDIGGPVYLLFDPAISCHFHLVQFVWGCEESEEVDIIMDEEEEEVHDLEEDLPLSVHVYSSETGQWIHIQSGWDRDVLEVWRNQCFMGYYRRFRCTVLNGIQQFIILTGNQIAVVDVQGGTRKIIPVPMMAKKQHWTVPRFVAISHGHLHYIRQTADAQLSIWVLEDDDTQKWVLKHSVNIVELFGKLSQQSRRSHRSDYRVVAMHPHGNVIFIVQNRNLNLISYDMDHKVVSVIGTLENDTSTIDVVPYVPCFLELPKH